MIKSFQQITKKLKKYKVKSYTKHVVFFNSLPTRQSLVGSERFLYWVQLNDKIKIFPKTRSLGGIKKEFRNENLKEKINWARNKIKNIQDRKSVV